jgi:hypothetical protein
LRGLLFGIKIFHQIFKSVLLESNNLLQKKRLASELLSESFKKFNLKLFEKVSQMFQFLATQAQF